MKPRACAAVLTAALAISPALAGFEILNLGRGRALMTGEPTLKWRVDWEITAVRVRCERRDVDATHPAWEETTDLNVSEYCLLRGRIPHQWWYCNVPLGELPDTHMHKCSVQSCVAVADQAELTCGGQPLVEEDVTCMFDVEYPDGECPEDVMAAP